MNGIPDELPRVFCNACGLQEGHACDQDCETCVNLARAQREADEHFGVTESEAA